MSLCIDLHSHTLESDGKLTPAELVELARSSGVDVLAITDHDTCAAIEPARNAITSHGLPLNLISGIEISCSAGEREVHLVGLGVDPADSSLNKVMKHQCELRRERAERIDDKLTKAGRTGVLEHTLANSSQVITRSHIAQSMVDLGYVADLNRAFKQFLGKRARAYVRQNWISLAEAIELIHSAGGCTVLAHPGRYALSSRQLSRLIELFAAEGGQAMEIGYSNIQPDVVKFLTRKAKEFDLAGSQGSDFHDPSFNWVKLGRMPTVPKELDAVWERYNLF